MSFSHYELIDGVVCRVIEMDDGGRYELPTDLPALPCAEEEPF